jgi:GNAT superfamily N-acetyltransferase
MSTRLDVLLLRPLAEADREPIGAHLRALSPEQSRLRFSHAPSEAALGRYVSSLRFGEDAVFGAQSLNGRIVALAHMAFDDEEGGMELGVSVDADWQGRGLGRALLARALAIAAAKESPALTIHCAWDNAPMLALCRLAGGRVQRGFGEMSVRLALPKASESLPVEGELWGPWASKSLSGRYADLGKRASALEPLCSPEARRPRGPALAA